MDKAKRAQTAETLKQPSLRLTLRAPYLYPDHMVVGMRLVCANMRPLVAQARGHLFGIRHPAMLLERHPFPIRNHIKAERAV
jgi:hypothetical protein